MEGGIFGGYGVAVGYWPTMWSLRGILGGDGVAVGSLWGCKAIRRDVGLPYGHCGGRKGDSRGDIWGIWGCCGVLGHHGVTEGDMRGILGGYGVVVGSLWGHKVIRRDVGLP